MLGEVEQHGVEERGVLDVRAQVAEDLPAPRLVQGPDLGMGLLDQEGWRSSLCSASSSSCSRRAAPVLRHGMRTVSSESA
ncbi:hypothetical protein BOG92_000120 [Streptomyces sp. WAC00263]|nr:hypothetical protein BOG92_000120 [Streptomyces sp. WAC00263]